MKYLAVVFIAVFVSMMTGLERTEALPQGCYTCARNNGYPQEKCCDDCVACRHNFDVEVPKNPDCRKSTSYRYDIEKVKGCHKETYDRLDAVVEVLPDKGCKKSYNYHYGVEKPCHCNEETYDTHDFEVLAPKREKHCSKFKLEAHADHPVRHCQCDCNKRRYVKETGSRNRTHSNFSDEDSSTENGSNRIRRVRRNVVDPSSMNDPFYSSEINGRREFIKHARRPRKPQKQPFQRFLARGPRQDRKEKQDFYTTQGGFLCHCMPADQTMGFRTGENGELVGAPQRLNSNPEKPVYIGDSSNPITYNQIKQHMDALPSSEYSPYTNEVIANLTVLFYDIYQQKHKKNFTLPLKYGTRTVVEKGNGLQQYDIKPIEGEYKPPTLNHLASKGLNVLGRKIDRKTGQQGPRKNRLQGRS